MGSKSRIAIVGGGLVGSTAALALARCGFAVTLFDRKRPKVSQGLLGLDIRNVALSQASQSLLADNGIWSKINAAPYSQMHVWEQWGTASLHFDAAEVGCQELGWLVEMSPLLCRAWQCMNVAANLDVVVGNIEGVEISDVGVSVMTGTSELGTGEPRVFDFLIAADGAHSIAQRALQLPIDTQPTGQVALATVVRTSASHKQTAWQRFLNDGPLAFLPSPDEHVSSIVWSQSEAQAQRRAALPDADFCDEIGQAFEHRLGDVLEVDQRICFALTQQRVKDCAPHTRVLLIGDALRVVHPLAGQGVNLGLEDVTCLLRVATAHKELSMPGIWRRFARQRQTRARLMIQTMSALQKFYGSANPAVSLLRNIGVQSFNTLDALKHQVMREAMGLNRLK